MGQMVPAHICYRSCPQKYTSNQWLTSPHLTSGHFYVNVCVCESTDFYRNEPNRQCVSVQRVGGMYGPPWNCCHRRQVSSCGTCGHVLLWEGDNDSRKLASHFKQPAPRQLMQISPLTLFRCPSRPTVVLKFSKCILCNRNPLLFFFYRHSIEDKHNAFKKRMSNIRWWGGEKKENKTRRRRRRKKKAPYMAKKSPSNWLCPQPNFPWHTLSCVCKVA